MYSLLRSFVDPLAMSFILIGLTLAYAWWKNADARRGLRAITVVFLLAWIATSEAAAYFATGLLEWRYPPVLEMPAEAEAIVLLSSGALAPSEFLPEATPGSATLRRCRRAAQLYHSRPRPIVACGGKFDPKNTDDTLAEVMQRELILMGVDQNDILLEEGSGNTYHNAGEAKRVVDEHGWSSVVLVTDATHLMRSELCFEKHGLDVIPAGAHYEALRAPNRLADFVPSTTGANKCNLVLHEVMGLVWYKLRGRI